MITIGGSEAGAICGVDEQFSTPTMKLAEKLGVWSPPFTDNAAAEAGRWMEPSIVRWYESATGRLVITGDELAGAIDGEIDIQTFREPDALADLVAAIKPYVERVSVREGQRHFRSRRYPHATGALDGFAFDDAYAWGYFDAKNMDKSMRRKWREESPQKYLLQLDHYGLLIDPDREFFQWHGLAALFGGNDLVCRDYERSEERETFLLREELEFIRRVEDAQLAREEGRKIELPTQFLEGRELPAVRALWPKPEKPKWVACPPVVELEDGTAITPRQIHDLWTMNKAKRSELQDEWVWLKAVITALMGDADQLGMHDDYYFERAADGQIRSKRE